MKTRHSKLLGELAGVAAAVTAACVLLTYDAEREADAAAAALRDSEAELAQGHATLPSERLSVLVGRTQSASRAITECSNLLREETALYGRLGELAKASGVRIDQLVPATANVTSHQLPPPGDTGAVPAPKDTRSTYTMTVVGGYAQVAAFMRECEVKAGLAVIRSARVSPFEGNTQGIVRAVIVSEHFAIDLGNDGSGGLP